MDGKGLSSPISGPRVSSTDLETHTAAVEPLAVEALTERHMVGLVDSARVKSPYFRLLARDPDALRAAR